ncbi:LysR substrate-binding domain-containing protein [Mesorhizobium sp. RMAD-H1]|uniref:LysR substrate-binding domain-containing protein n=1 Tax=Mesorhizobium sp. RMAD-H1 TaxID=2587065 RepID=UPI001612AF9D|nr:LysR substrate-binding domain-containing protein [Mesorhizobium sp. RMAD-H1]MBB2974448.1 DNA-binding transcriptional LysR family regulator [Mesorhizobium sp. RMAD-H1]
MFAPVLLRTFQVVAQEASFTKAAGRLNLTQSAVSAHVRRLEEQTGKALFVRNTRSVALTSEGELLLGYARAILRLNETAQLKLSGMTDGVHLRIGASDDFMSAWLPGLLQRFQAGRPGLTLEVCVANTGSLLTSMELGELDLVLGSRCHGDQMGQLLWREQLVWAYAKGADLENVLPLPLALFPEPCPYRDAALATLAAAGRESRIAVVSPSVAGLRAAAATGLAVTPLSRSLLTSQLRALDNELPELPEVEFMVFSRPHGGPKELGDLTNEITSAATRF